MKNNKQKERFTVKLDFFTKPENAETRANLEALKRDFKANGNSLSLTNKKGEKAVVYRPELASILTTIEIPATGYSEKHEPFKTTLNGTAYKTDYFKGFMDGKKYFEKEFKRPANLHSEDGKKYIQTLHNNYFHLHEKHSFQGWSYWKQSFPFIITNEIIYDYGFYCALVHSVDELANLHTGAFAGFDVCRYPTIDALFEAAYDAEIIPKENNESAKQISKQIHASGFDEYIFETYNVRISELPCNEQSQYFTKEHFKAYLNYHHRKEAEKKQEIEKEKESWKIDQIQPNPLPTFEQDKETVKEYLKPLNGNWNRQRIMKQDNFERLVEYVTYMVENQKLPLKIVAIPQTNVSTEFIRKTFHRLHKTLYGKKKKQYWIDFLHKGFKQFQSWERNTTDKNFATYRGNYEQDLQNITR